MRERGGAMAVVEGGSTGCLAGAMLILAEGLPAPEALGVAVGILSGELQDRAGRGARGGAGGSSTGDGSSPARVRALECIRAGLAGESRVDAFWLGEAYQLALDARPDGGGSRRRRGVFYTPRGLVDHLVERTLGERGGARSARVLDPACGCGGFLVAAGRRLAADLARGEVAALLHGIDIDPLAVELCRLALWLEFGDHGDPGDGPDRLSAQVRCADALLDPPGEGSFDAVLTNPPFLSQLAASTARGKEHQRRLRERFGPSVRVHGSRGVVPASGGGLGCARGAGGHGAAGLGAGGPGRLGGAGACPRAGNALFALGRYRWGVRGARLHDRGDAAARCDGRGARQPVCRARVRAGVGGRPTGRSGWVVGAPGGRPARRAAGQAPGPVHAGRVVRDHGGFPGRVLRDRGGGGGARAGGGRGRGAPGDLRRHDRPGVRPVGGHAGPNRRSGMGSPGRLARWGGGWSGWAAGGVAGAAGAAEAAGRDADQGHRGRGGSDGGDAGDHAGDHGGAA